MTTRRKIGFAPSYMTESDLIINEETVEIQYVDPTLADLRQKIAEMTMYMASSQYARLTPKNKIAKLLDYNMFVQLETKLSGRI